MAMVENAITLGNMAKSQVGEIKSLEKKIKSQEEKIKSQEEVINSLLVIEFERNYWRGSERYDLHMATSGFEELKSMYNMTKSNLETAEHRLENSDIIKKQLQRLNEEMKNAMSHIEIQNDELDAKLKKIEDEKDDILAENEEQKTVTSIEGYNYCAVLNDDCSEYRWAHGLKTKDGLIDAVKQWYAEIADLRGKYQLIVVMRDLAGENISHEIQEFFTDKGAESYFSTAYEPWHEGLGEAGIKSVLLIERTETAESGWKVVVLCRQPWKALPKRHFQTSSWYDTICWIIWNEKGCFEIQTIWMQGTCSSEEGEERERKIYTSRSGSNSP
jgi:hypothetical protein